MRVVVVERSALVAAGLTALLEARQHVVARVVRRAGQVADAVAGARAQALVVGPGTAPAPDVLLACLTHVRHRYPRLGVVVLRGVPALEGAVVLPAPVDGAAALDAALDRVADGGVVVEPDRGPAQLTEREREVLRLVADGLSNHGVARRLNVSTNTVGTHLRHVFDKLDLPDDPGANPRVLAVLTYLGLADPDPLGASMTPEVSPPERRRVPAR
jgi:DNA-binding NarL/FixJ family response regulator